jgi:hypothetical protein
MGALLSVQEGEFQGLSFGLSTVQRVGGDSFGDVSILRRLIAIIRGDC